MSGKDLRGHRKSATSSNVGIKGNLCKYQNEVEKIIKGGDAECLVKTAKQIAKDMIKKKKKSDEVNEKVSVSTSQIRNIFGTAKKIEMRMNSTDQRSISEAYAKLLLLKPKMAYANGRFNKGNRRPGFKVLVDCLSEAIDMVEGQDERMKNFFNFFEAILAYHRAEGGK
ncbi:MAG: type III-A CRISPR-associated protein Csm2 [Deltaproteobacteria bacterium]|nr:type III-A CRISPR-associated protein Csm2 [Deltaproteobacteria bacterium]